MSTNRKFRIVVTICALMAGLSATARAKIIYVDNDAKEPGNGSSWANPYQYLQAALTAAVAGGTKSGWLKDSTGLTRVCLRSGREVRLAAHRPKWSFN